MVGGALMRKVFVRRTKSGGEKDREATISMPETLSSRESKHWSRYSAVL
jgi:hypothetical protein